MKETETVMGIEYLMDLIKSVLTIELLQKKYRGKNLKNPLFGHCYVASEALYHLIRSLSFNDHLLEYKPCRGRDSDNITHWWLQDNEGKILDPTAEQYTSQSKVPPYHKGLRGPFLTRIPSKRALIVIERVKKKLDRKQGE